jgi:hypothetical protein
MNFNKIDSFYGQYQNDPDLGRVAYNHEYTQKYIKISSFKSLICINYFPWAIPSLWNTSIIRVISHGYIRDCKRPDLDRYRFDIVRKNCLFCWNSWKNNDRGANKSLIIHKTSQNNRNNIIWSCIWVFWGKKSHQGSSIGRVKTKTIKLVFVAPQGLVTIFF